MISPCVRALVAVAVLAPRAFAQSPAAEHEPSGLQASDAVRRHVGASVVRIVASVYRAVEGSDRDGIPWVRRGVLTGAGVVIGEGLIATSSDLLLGAEHVDVTVTTASGLRQTVPAALVGLAPEVGLALVGVDDLSMRPLPIAPASGLARGQAVFTVHPADAGLPEVRLGAIAALAVSVAPALTAWIQTTVPVGDGACGGPVVDAAGALVGISACPPVGDVEAGYAVPGAVLALALPQLREFGHLHHARLGLTVETITPELRAGLRLGDALGAVVSDVAPGGPADSAGLTDGDILTALGGLPLTELSIAEVSQQLLALIDGQRVPLHFERHGRAGIAWVTAEVPRHDCDRPALVDLSDHVIDQLGVIALAVDPSLMRMFPDMRTAAGVVVLWHVDRLLSTTVPLARGDVIRAVNGVQVASADDLRRLLGRVGPGEPLVLQVERDGALSYLTLPSRRR